MSNLFKDEKRFELDLELNVKKNGQKCHPEINEFVIHSFNERVEFGS